MGPRVFTMRLFCFLSLFHPKTGVINTSNGSSRKMINYVNDSNVDEINNIQHKKRRTRAECLMTVLSHNAFVSAGSVN
jgi:hypothetical protein